jgi:hypothetical protein
MDMKNKTVPQERYYVMQVTGQEAKEKLQNHHLKRNPQISHAFGLFDRTRNNQMTAVVTFGSPASPNVTRGVCGVEERLNVIELNRLWVDSSVSNEAVTFFLTTSMARVPKEIIMSYVQPEHDRISRIYKGLKFLYTGLTAIRRDPTPVDDRHNRHAHYTLSKANLVFRPRKHRFVHFNALSDVREKELIKKLKYDVFSY